VNVRDAVFFSVKIFALRRRSRARNGLAFDRECYRASFQLRQKIRMLCALCDSLMEDCHAQPPLFYVTERNFELLYGTGRKLGGIVHGEGV
jgi:hypothetical protein